MKGDYMKNDLTATEIIRTYIDAINELIEKESGINQLQLITDYSNNLNSLLNKSKAKISSQIKSPKNVVNLCDDPLDLNKQSTFGNNTFSSFNSFKTKKQNEKNKIEKNKDKEHKSLKPISNIVPYKLGTPVDPLSTSDSN